MEVHHLLDFVRLGDPVAINELIELADAHRWPSRGRIPGSTERNVPLRRWCDYVCAYLRDGCEAIGQMALDPEEWALDLEDGLEPGLFAFGVLEEIRSTESVAALILTTERALAMDECPDGVLQAAAGALCSSLRGDPPALLDRQGRKRLRRVLHDLVARMASHSHLAAVYLALGAVGDIRSIEVVQERPALGSPWKGLEAQVIRTIRSRLGKKR